MSSIIHTVYFSCNDEVTPLTGCEDYSHAEDKFEEITVPIFFEKNNKKPYKIVKYVEGTTSTDLISSFQSNVEYPIDSYIFIKRKHEVTIYEKILVKGTLYNSHAVKYVGKIGVISQKRNLETDGSVLEKQLEHYQKIAQRQEAAILALENEISLLKASQISQTPVKSRGSVKKNDKMSAVIDELTQYFARRKLNEEETLVMEIETFTI